jgi:hypothetical protein
MKTLFGIALALFAPAAVAAGFSLRDSVIVDPQRAVAYVAAPAGGIEALDLSTGRPAWTAANAAMPLAINGRLILTRGQEAKPGARMPLVVLDDTGRVVREAAAPLPDGVRALVDDNAMQRFRATARADGDSFVVTWTYHSRTLPASVKELDRRDDIHELSGSFRFEPASGRVIALEAVDPAPAQTPPWRAGAVLATPEGGHGGPLVLKRQDAATGRPLPDQLIARRSIAELRSADGAWLMVSERVGAGGPDDPEYRWSVWSLESAEKGGELRNDVSASPFFVQGESLVYVAQPHAALRGATWIEEPLKIEAVRLSAATTSWNRPVRDVAYRGPRPSGR